MRLTWPVVVSALLVCVGALALPQAGHSAGCSFSARDCEILSTAHSSTITILDDVDEEDVAARRAEQRADGLTRSGSEADARVAWRAALGRRIAARTTLNAYLAIANDLIGFAGSVLDDPAATALVQAQFRALASYLRERRDLWDTRIAQAILRVRTPLPAADNRAKDKAVASAGATARASAAAVGAAVGPGRHPWPAVTDDAGLRDLWTRFGTENVAVIAGFERLTKGARVSTSAAERKAIADAMAVLLGEYRKTWKVMLSRLNGAKGLASYAGCRTKLVEHAKGLRARDALIVRLISAVRNGDAAATQRALAAQRAQGTRNRELAARVRACLKAAAPPASPPGPVSVPARLDLSSLCPKSVVRLGVTLVQVAAAQTDYVFHCDYALPTNTASKPVRVDIVWWSPTSGSSGGVGNCTERIDRYSTGGKWYSGSHYLSVQSLAAFDDRQAVLKKTLDDAESRGFALRCDYKG